MNYKTFYELKTMDELVKLKQVTEERIKTIDEVIKEKGEKK